MCQTLGLQNKLVLTHTHKKVHVVARNAYTFNIVVSKYNAMCIVKVHMKFYQNAERKQLVLP